MIRYTVAVTPSITGGQQKSLRLIQQFNRDEVLWHSLKGRRTLRRKVLRRSREQHKKLDIAEFARVKPPEDLIGTHQRRRSN